MVRTARLRFCYQRHILIRLSDTGSTWWLQHKKSHVPRKWTSSSIVLQRQTAPGESPIQFYIGPWQKSHPTSHRSGTFALPAMFSTDMPSLLHLYALALLLVACYQITVVLKLQVLLSEGTIMLLYCYRLLTRPSGYSSGRLPRLRPAPFHSQRCQHRRYRDQRSLCRVHALSG